MEKDHSMGYAVTESDPHLSPFAWSTVALAPVKAVSAVTNLAYLQTTGEQASDSTGHPVPG